MKIAVVCPYGLDRPGGVQDQALQLIEWLREAGHDAWLVAPGTGDVRAAPVGGTVLFPVNRSRAPIALSPGAARAALEAVRTADVVHLHEPFVPAVSLSVLLGKGPPKVGTFHADPGGGVRAAYRWARPVLRRWGARLAVATAVSNVAAAAVRGLCRPRVIPNGIDVSSYEVDEARRPARVAFIGRDEPRKGLDVLLDAWPSVRRRVPAAQLLVVGAERDQLPSGATCFGAVDPAEKRRLLASSTVLCAPNTGGESFGLVVAEGMAAGCAVVASGLAAFAAVLGDAGVLVAPGDAVGLGAALASLLEDPHRAGELGKRARSRVRRFDREAVTSAYLEAYHDAVGR